MKPPQEKSSLHPRNRHRSRYDFPTLVGSCPDLARFVSVNAYGDESIDFADPEAVKTLNRALLFHFYGIAHWDIPPGYLCPPIPGRADYIHHVADLLGECNGGVIPRGASVRVLDIGVGANCIYPLLGHREYEWSFLGSDMDTTALASAKNIVQANNLEKSIQLRFQPSPSNIFRDILQEGEGFEVSICNPPFHASLNEARAGTRRKLKNLGLGATSLKNTVLNFGGQGAELWCEGGEAGFVRRMIDESAQIPYRCFWFSTLISKESNLQAVHRALKKAGVVAQRTLPMAQGQKRSRIVVWTFLDDTQQATWREARWGLCPPT